MKRASRLIPVIAGAIAGGVIALILAGGSNNTSTHTVTSTSTVISRQAPS